MVQVLISVPGGRTQALDLSSFPVAASDILVRLQSQLPLDTDDYVVTWNNKRFHGDDMVPLQQPGGGPLPVLGVMARGGLRGGKGGFGAMLRSMGKGAGSRKTTDFGACRDLYGRRLRHVNDEIRLKKWLEDKEREAQDKDRKRDKRSIQGGSERTESGIAGWYLSVPGWAEIRPGKQQGYMKQRRKTALCRQWLDARQDRLPPRGAPRWWGCPRGKECDWAHGEEELRGQGLADLEAYKKEEQAKVAHASMETYVGSAGYDTNSVQSAVMEGLKREQRARKKGKSGPLELHQGDDEDDAPARILPVGFGAETWSVVPGECPWVEVVCGQLEVQNDGTLRGGQVVGEFATAAVVGLTLQAPGCWYYEVEILAIEGPMQVGWANQYFEADADEGDGVGDDINSYAYDGVRVKAWNAENEKDYGKKWEVGDVVGCLLSLGDDNKDGYVRYYLNGKDLGKAFTGIKAKAGDAKDSLLLSYYPAVSLESGDAIKINIGVGQPFKYTPTGEAGRFKGIGESMDFVVKTGKKDAQGEGDEKEAAVPEKTTASKTTSEKEASNGSSSKKVPAPPATTSSSKAAPSAPATTTTTTTTTATTSGGDKEEPVKEKAKKQAAAPVKPKALDLSSFASPEELEALGLDRLKAALMALQIKCGGTLQERASRLWSVRGLKPEEIDPKLKVNSK